MSNCLIIYSELGPREFTALVQALPFVASTDANTVTDVDASRHVSYERYSDGDTEHPERDETSLGQPIILDYGYPSPFIKKIVTELARKQPIWIDLDVGDLLTGGEFVFQDLSDPNWNWFLGSE